MATTRTYRVQFGNDQTPREVTFEAEFVMVTDSSVTFVTDSGIVGFVPLSIVQWVKANEAEESAKEAE